MSYEKTSIIFGVFLPRLCCVIIVTNLIVACKYYFALKIVEYEESYMKNNVILQLIFIVWKRSIIDF